MQDNENLLDIVRAEVEAGAPMVGVNGRAARDLAQAVVERIAMRVGGQELYVPKRDKVRMRRQAVTEFNGVNGRHLCKKYGISERTLRRWLVQTRGTRQVGGD